MSKRKRKEIEQDITVYRNKKQAVEKLLARVEAELAVMDAAEAEDRALCVPWWAYVRAAEKSRCAWIKEPHDSILYDAGTYACHYEDGCYYQNSGDVQYQTLYVIRPVEGPRVVVCGNCDRDSSLFDAVAKQPFVRLDPSAFEPEIADVLRQVAALATLLKKDDDDDELNDQIDALFDAMKK